MATVSNKAHRFICILITICVCATGQQIYEQSPPAAPLEHGKHLQRRRRASQLRFLVVVLQLRLSPGRFSAKWRFSAFQICGDCRPDGIERSSAQSAAAEAAAAEAAGAAHKMYIVCHLFGFYGFSLVFRRVAPAESRESVACSSSSCGNFESLPLAGCLPLLQSRALEQLPTLQPFVLSGAASRISWSTGTRDQGPDPTLHPLCSCRA